MVEWLLVTAIIGLPMGALSTFFLKSPTYVTDVRLANPRLFSTLPIGGVIFTCFYTRFGKNVSRGNNLVVEQGNGGEEDIPLRLIPLTSSDTIITHSFGSSVGCEGVAVQMGSAIANAVGKVSKLSALEQQVIIISRISAGSSSVLDIPLARMVSGLEVLAAGKVCAEALFPSSFTGLFTNSIIESFGVTHTHYPMGKTPTWLVELFVKLFLISICSGLAGWVFSRSIVFLKKTYADWFANVYLHVFPGASIVVLSVLILDNQRYLGLSLPLLKDVFVGNTQPFDFAGKLFFMVPSLGAGFQGGGVMPLFEIRATLGSSPAPLLHLPIPFLVGLGFTDVPSGAMNTPVACFIMGIELFGSEAAAYFFMVCLISSMCSRNSGIYASQ